MTQPVEIILTPRQREFIIKILPAFEREKNLFLLKHGYTYLDKRYFIPEVSEELKTYITYSDQDDINLKCTIDLQGLILSDYYQKCLNVEKKRLDDTVREFEQDVEKIKQELSVLPF